MASSISSIEREIKELSHIFQITKESMYCGRDIEQLSLEEIGSQNQQVFFAKMKERFEALGKINDETYWKIDKKCITVLKTAFFELARVQKASDPNITACANHLSVILRKAEVPFLSLDELLEIAKPEREFQGQIELNLLVTALAQLCMAKRDLIQAFRSFSAKDYSEKASDNLVRMGLSIKPPTEEAEFLSYVTLVSKNNSQGLYSKSLNSGAMRLHGQVLSKRLSDEERSKVDRIVDLLKNAHHRILDLEYADKLLMEILEIGLQFPNLEKTVDQAIELLESIFYHSYIASEQSEALNPHKTYHPPFMRILVPEYLEYHQLNSQLGELRDETERCLIPKKAMQLMHKLSSQSYKAMREFKKLYRIFYERFEKEVVPIYQAIYAKVISTGHTVESINKLHGINLLVSVEEYALSLPNPAKDSLPVPITKESIEAVKEELRLIRKSREVPKSPPTAKPKTEPSPKAAVKKKSTPPTSPPVAQIKPSKEEVPSPKVESPSHVRPKKEPIASPPASPIKKTLTPLKKPEYVRLIYLYTSPGEKLSHFELLLNKFDWTHREILNGKGGRMVKFAEGGGDLKPLEGTPGLFEYRTFDYGGFRIYLTPRTFLYKSEQDVKDNYIILWVGRKKTQERQRGRGDIDEHAYQLLKEAQALLEKKQPLILRKWQPQDC